MPTFTCDPRRPSRPLPHHWEFSVGSGYAALGLRADWQAQLARCHRELGFEHVRFHGIFADAMRVVTPEGPRFLDVDRVYDAILDLGMKPLVELSFMPSPLASGSTTVFAYAANVTPPKDPDGWKALVRSAFRHWVDRYGRDEVASWPVEVWNEPDMASFWTASRDDYFALYADTVRAIAEVEPSIRVGGPVTSKNMWLEEFLAFCDAEGLVPDFVSTHHYPTDASEQGSTLDRLKAAPRGRMIDQARAARRIAGDRPLYYTEWNSSSDDRDPRHDEPYAAAYAVRTLLGLAGVVDGSSWWVFSDLFVEHELPATPYHGGFGLLNTLGVPKPVYRGFELARELGDELLACDGAHETVDAWFTRRSNDLCAMITNSAMPGNPIRTESVTLEWAGLDRVPAAVVRRVDGEPKAVWEAMGSPTYPDDRAVSVLESASSVSTRAWPVEAPGRVTVDVPPHGVCLVSLR